MSFDKASPRVALYTHRDLRTLERLYAGQRIHRAGAIEVFAVDRGLLEALVERLERLMSFALTVTDGALFVDVGGESLSGGVEHLHLPV